MSEKKILVIGPYPPPLGGGTVECLTLTNCLMECYTTTSITKFNTNREGFALLWLPGLISKVLRADSVFVYGSHRRVCLFCIFFIPFSKLFRKRSVVKITGGNLWEYFNSGNFALRTLIKLTLFRANTVFLETRYLVEKFRQHHPGVHWFPMTRLRSGVSADSNNGTVHSDHAPSLDSDARLRVVYLGHINEAKGIPLLLDAADGLDGISIDAFGEFEAKDGRQLSEDTFRGRNVNYQGVVQPSELSKVLDQYDVLVLPTRYIGEGYPGVIIEAKRAGLAVLSTRWRSIPEIVNHKVDGLLITPGDVTELTAALNELNSNRDLLRTLQKGSFESFSNFDCQVWCRKLIEHLTGNGK